MTNTDKMRVNLTTEQVFTEPEYQAEYVDILNAAERYEQSARSHDEEAERLRTLASQALEQAETLRHMSE